MTREEAFDAWAPSWSVWSDWAKPVLFAQMPETWARETMGGVEESDMPWNAGVEQAALVVDLPGELGVAVGMMLACRGYRPVPLYNGAANDSDRAPGLEGMLGSAATINVWPIMRALWRGAEELQRLRIAPEAPPAFLIDSRRGLGERVAAPGIFDNRWILFATDFPSGRMLRDHGITRAIVISNAGNAPGPDLSHVLAKWQEQGIAIAVQDFQQGAEARAITVRKPRLWEAWWYHLTAAVGLRRRELGGFGGMVPMPSSGGGG